LDSLSGEALKIDSTILLVERFVSLSEVLKRRLRISGCALAVFGSFGFGWLSGVAFTLVASVRTFGLQSYQEARNENDYDRDS
jgi:hypothetical protein